MSIESTTLDSAFWITSGAILLLLVLSGFFSGSETALTAASRVRMHAAEKEGDRRAPLGEDACPAFVEIADDEIVARPDDVDRHRPPHGAEAHIANAHQTGLSPLTTTRWIARFSFTAS